MHTHAGAAPLGGRKNSHNGPHTQVVAAVVLPDSALRRNASQTDPPLSLPTPPRALAL